MSKHKKYKEELVDFLDDPTKTGYRSLHRKAGAWAKQKVNDDLKSNVNYDDMYFEAVDAIYCHLYGPCKKCKGDSNESNIRV